MGDAKAASRWDGGFVVVWDTLDADGDGYAVFGQAFGANGDREGPETAVNVQTSGSQSLPSVAVTGPELFVVAWSSELQDPDGTTGVYGRVMQFCPTGRDCQLSSWSEWTVCSVACGGGTQWRSRTVLEEGRAPGLTCDQAGPLIETQTCNTASCLPPADGVNCSTQWCYQDNCYVQLPGTYTRPELFAKCTALSTCNGGGATSPKSCVVEVNNPGEQAFLVQNVLPMFGSGYVWTSNLNGGPGNDGVCTIMGPTGALIIPGTGGLGVNFGLCEVPRPTLCPPLVDGQ
ncbi:MAG: hypothetical protein BJ554DRAFT_1170 [Olpidium bornovanus]|uniref:Spondin-like TSP1 domain-containing protein n=1 Tax=Olpidium bornovanus TaxID=278681 RepID=A0A8H7ZSG0_9FUNG|nr:MAG: hypothetical protein BJ554DRAFT_1170 [Olpidium bornovanus]